MLIFGAPVRMRSLLHFMPPASSMVLYNVSDVITYATSIFRKFFASLRHLLLASYVIAAVRIQCSNKWPSELCKGFDNILGFVCSIPFFTNPSPSRDE